jgi:hypothetical protein
LNANQWILKFPQKPIRSKALSLRLHPQAVLCWQYPELFALKMVGVLLDMPFISCDFFGGGVEGCSAFVLTHAHKDHMTGLAQVMVIIGAQ